MRSSGQSLLLCLGLGLCACDGVVVDDDTSLDGGTQTSPATRVGDDEQSSDTVAPSTAPSMTPPPVPLGDATSMVADASVEGTPDATAVEANGTEVLQLADGGSVTIHRGDDGCPVENVARGGFGYADDDFEPLPIELGWERAYTVIDGNVFIEFGVPPYTKDSERDIACIREVTGNIFYDDSGGALPFTSLQRVGGTITAWGSSGSLANLGQLQSVGGINIGTSHVSFEALQNLRSISRLSIESGNLLEGDFRYLVSLEELEEAYLAESLLCPALELFEKIGQAPEGRLFQLDGTPVDVASLSCD